MLNFIDKKIRQAFSDAALHYDVLASLQKEIGRDLLARLRSVENQLFIDEKIGQREIAILDIGMGTGWLTKRLADFFVDAKVYGLDFASGMVEIAKGKYDEFHIIQANACALPFKEKSFDLIISNLTYQWIMDLPKAFDQAYHQLKPEGHFYFTLFGGETCQELFVSLEKTAKDNVFDQQLFMKRLGRRDQVRKALEGSGFKDIKIDYERIKTRFPDMLSLVKWLKDIGANTLDRDFFVGKDWLNRANDHYNQTFRDHLGVFATFEVIWVKASK